MKQSDASDNSSALSRRTVLAGGAALTTALAFGPAWARGATAEDETVALITGTSSGFGRLMAETFARKGVRVIATMRAMSGRNAPAARELRALGAQGLPIDLVEIDVTDPGSVDSGVARALRLAGRIDVLINNAGIVNPGPAALQPTSAFSSNIETNAIGAARMFRAVAPQMRERGRGYMIQFSSTLGRVLDPMLGGYCASKLAAEAAADAFAYEEAMFGIEVTILQVAGPYPTRLQANALRYFDAMLAGLPAFERPQTAQYKEHIRRMREGLVPDRSLNPQEVADAVQGLLAMARGTRPRRFVIGPAKDISDRLNRAHDDVQQAMIKESGLSEFTTLRSRP